MKMTVYEIVQGPRLVVSMIDHDRRAPVGHIDRPGVPSKIAPSEGKEPLMVRSIAETDGYDLEVDGISTPSYKTTLRLVEQEDGSIVLRFCNVEIHLRDIQSADARNFSVGDQVSCI